MPPEKTRQSSQRDDCALARPRSLASLEPCPLGLRDAFLDGKPYGI
ncbi:MAG: hypothetical protein Q8L57_01180 [bacterium]|nr:hypothetical protein [bacterium]